MDKTEKPTQKTPTFSESPNLSNKRAGQATDEFEADALFAGLFDEDLPHPLEMKTQPDLGEREQTIQKTPSPTKEKQKAPSLFAEEEKAPLKPPPQETEEQPFANHTPAAPSSKEPTSLSPSISAEEEGPYKYKVTPPPPSEISKEASLQDLVAVLEENITRLREERLTPAQQDPPKPRKEPSQGLDLPAPSSKGGLLGLLETSPQPSGLSSTSKQTPKILSSKTNILQERFEKLQEELSTQTSREPDADWHFVQKLHNFLESAGHNAKRLPISQNLFTFPSWFWLLATAIFAALTPWLGTWGQVLLSTCLGFWLLEQGLGWPLAQLFTPQKSGSLLYVPPPPKVQAAQKEHEGDKEHEEVVLAVPYRLTAPEAPYPHSLLRFLPKQLQRLDLLYHPRVLGGIAFVLWLIAISAPLTNRSTKIVLLIFALVLCILLAGLVFENLLPSQKPEVAWSLAASLGLYEQLTQGEKPHHVHLLWFDARDQHWCTEHFFHGPTLPPALREALWIGLWPYSPQDQELALVETEGYLQKYTLHPHLKHLLAETESEHTPQRVRLSTRLWGWMLHQQKRPLLLFTSPTALSTLQTTKNLPFSLAKASKEAAEEEASFLVTSIEEREQEKVGSPSEARLDTTAKLYAFSTSLLDKWRARHMRATWLPLWLGLWWFGGTPAQAASARCDKLYKTETKRCEQLYTKGISRCKVKGKSKSACVQQEKQGTSSCKALYDRVKSDCSLRPLTEEQTNTCNQRERQAKTACKSPALLQAECAQQAKPCLTACEKTNDACEKQCHDQQLRCLRDQEDAWVRCQRQARQEGRRCKRKAQDREIERVYRCLQESVAARLRCQRSKRDERTSCEDKFEDQTRSCRRTRWDERRSCYEDALQRRLRCH